MQLECQTKLKFAGSFRVAMEACRRAGGLKFPSHQSNAAGPVILASSDMSVIPSIGSTELCECHGKSFRPK